jgi:hypothetical protein
MGMDIGAYVRVIVKALIIGVWQSGTACHLRNLKGGFLENCKPSYQGVLPIVPLHCTRIVLYNI